MEQVNALKTEIYEKNKKRETMEIFIKTLEKQKMLLDTFDEQLWIALLDTATVRENGQIDFMFMSGICITE